MPALIRVVRCGQTEGYMAGEASEKVLPGELWGGPDDRFAPAGSSRGGSFRGTPAVFRLQAFRIGGRGVSERGSRREGTEALARMDDISLGLMGVTASII